MDGVLDAGTTALGASASGARTLYADVREGELYVATEQAGDGLDLFVYLVSADGTPVVTDANWGKAGQVTQWSAFLGDEESNDWEGWFNAAGDVDQEGRSSGGGSNTGGGVVEGKLDLLSELGVSLTELAAQDVRLAVGAFESWDGGALVPDASIGDGLNGDGDVLGGELITVSLALLMADIDGDGDLNLADVDALAITLQEGQNFLQADVDQDGTVGAADLDAWLTIKGTTHGDADLDGDVDLDDVATLVAAYGLNRGYIDDPEGWASWGDGDFDLDGDVDFADAMLLRRYADASVGEALLATVPEPGVAAGLLAMGLGLLRRRRLG
ncbi:MAG: PEP-CTERM sorting domain-containing protein [Planctomycetota bacterium]